MTRRFIKDQDFRTCLERAREQNHENWGLWSKDTRWGDDGYLNSYGYDPVETSFHILTTDGIRGRDILEHGVPRPTRGRVSWFAGSPPPRRSPWSTNTAGGLLRWLEPGPGLSNGSKFHLPLLV